jgi:hypothetical protein
LASPWVDRKRWNRVYLTHLSHPGARSSSHLDRTKDGHLPQCEQQNLSLSEAEAMVSGNVETSRIDSRPQAQTASTDVMPRPRMFASVIALPSVTKQTG